MYSRYPLYEERPEGRTQIRTPPPSRSARPAREEREERGRGHEPEPERVPQKGIFGSFEGIGGLLRGLKLDWDSGDILLILIILFLSAESDDTEIVILLALLLIGL
ncbi:MAG: hypothetical protein FWG93_01915 [Oscillospiraceae bacterium]|nr:hypothetical protein [Oscillospiraceae bacterium]